jgi:hypothetical protein
MQRLLVWTMIAVISFCGSALALAQEGGETPAVTPDPAEEEVDDDGYPVPTKCTMKFSMKHWSAFYKSGKGEGVITCENGQTARVKLKSKGGGITAGKGEIRKGKGSFSEVYDIGDLYGSYVVAEASAGAGKSAGAQVVTKGEISLALSGVGTGVELGFSFGKFTIKPRN